jgi:hypothetical protein
MKELTAGFRIAWPSLFLISAIGVELAHQWSAMQPSLCAKLEGNRTPPGWRNWQTQRT